MLIVKTFDLVQIWLINFKLSVLRFASGFAVLSVLSHESVICMDNAYFNIYTLKTSQTQCWERVGSNETLLTSLLRVKKKYLKWFIKFIKLESVS